MRLLRAFAGSEACDTAGSEACATSKGVQTSSHEFSFTMLRFSGIISAMFISDKHTGTRRLVS
jgi:hypothetical protein